MSDDTQVMSTAERLVYMAHQIARNLASLGEAQVVKAVADHLASFWDPRMKAQIIGIARDHPERLLPVVARAVALLASDATVEHIDEMQFNAVDETGRCDAG